MRFFSALVTAALFITVPLAARAFTISGKIVNGTTNATDISTDVLIVNPSGGMAQEKTVRAVGGVFTASDLGGDAPVYLVRVDYKGVMYSESVRPEGDHADVTLLIYESTTAWKDVRIHVPHMAASRQGDRLVIEELFEINNVTDPPRAITGATGPFRIRIPADHSEINGVFVSSLGVPVERSAQPTDRPDIFRVDYPIRPGLTRIGVSYSLPYTEASYTLRDSLLYDIEELTVFAADTGMEIALSGNDFTRRESAHGMTAFTGKSLKKSSVMTVAFSGGSGTSAVSDGGDDHSQISMVANDMQSVSIMMMLAVLVMLLGVTAVTLPATRNPLDSPERLRAHYDTLLRRLARLDDLHHAGAMSSQAYRDTRDELKTQLSSLVARMRRGETDAGKTQARSDDKGARRAS